MKISLSHWIKSSMSICMHAAGSRGPHAVQPSVSVPFQHHARKITDAVYFWVRRSFICYSDLLGHLAKFKEHLPTFPHHPVPDESDMQDVISAVANCAMLTVCPLSYSFLSCIASIVCGTTQNMASCGSPCTSTLWNMNFTRLPLFPHVHGDLHCLRWGCCQVVTS